MTASGTQERLDLAHVAEQIAREQTTAGDDGKPWSWQGYSGFATPHCKWGERPDSDILILSGALADEEMHRVLPFASNVSRLDTCVTVRVPDLPQEYLRGVYDSARNTTFPGGHKPSFEILQHSQRGDTLYVGARTSRNFGRLYNKHAESELEFYAGCYRYELEQKGDVAVARARRLAHDPDRQSGIQRHLHTFFSQRGVEPIFAAGEGRLPGPAFRRHPDDISRLLWLSGQVRKTLDTLDKHGLKEQALFALGLDSSHQTLDAGSRVGYNGSVGSAGAAKPNGRV